MIWWSSLPSGDYARVLGSPYALVSWGFNTYGKPEPGKYVTIHHLGQTNSDAAANGQRLETHPPRL